MKLFLRKAFVVSLLFCLVIGLSLLSFGCIFNNGSEDEVYGIYGVKYYHYNDTNNSRHNFADKYDYYLMVLYENGKVKFLSRLTNQTEIVYETTYIMNASSDKKDRISSITISEMNFITYKTNNNCVVPVEKKENTTLTFYPKLETMTFFLASFVRTNSDRIATESNKLTFHKMYSRTTDAKIEKAKNKQIEDIKSRADSKD